jgi:hypothetical protein
VTHLLHVGCHLVTTCLPRHWINGHGRDGQMNIGRRGRYGQIRAGGHKHVGRQLKGLQCTQREHVGCKYVGRKHVGRQLKRCNVPGVNMLGANLNGSNVLGANMLGANMYRAPTCTGRQHVGRQHVPGANLRAPTYPFFSQKTPQNCHFLLKKPKWIFLIFSFALSTVGSCPRLLGEHVQKLLQNLTSRIVR